MRKLMYRVKNADGAEFQTADYIEAKANGNTIEESYLVEVDTRTEKQKAAAREHAQKVREHLKKKRG